MSNFNQGNDYNQENIQNFDLDTFIEEETNCNGCFEFVNESFDNCREPFVDDYEQITNSFPNDGCSSCAPISNCNNDFGVYTFDIRLANNTNSCHFNNELLLDYVPEPYVYIPNTTKLDGRKPCEDFLNTCNGKLGYRGAIARCSVRFNAKLSNNQCCTMRTMNVSMTPMSSLSSIVERIGDLGLEGSFLRGNDCDDANLHMSQRVYTTERGCQQFDIFEFTIENRGKRTATSIMFEDQFPCNVISLPDKVKINGKNTCANNVLRRNANNILVNLPDIPPRGKLTLCIVGEVFCGFGQSKSKTNYGKLFYVSNFKYGEVHCPGSRTGKPETIQVREAVSNTKRVCKDSRNCI